MKCELVSNGDNPVDDMILVPRWVLSVLADYATGFGGCGGRNFEDGCATCRAIEITRQAAECN